MKPLLHTRWQSMDLIVARNGQEIDRIGARDIERVIIVYSARGDTPGDLAYAVLQSREHDLLFPPDSGIAGRVHFERQLFWNERRCVYWTPLAKAPLPRSLCPGLWFLRQPTPAFARLPRDELRETIARWPLEGPQSWDERKVARIARARPFGALRPLAPSPSRL
ncbi:MAG: hypothetical protein IT503_13590 [Burkholderiaceae bacterium]|nr:MAG: hypothetical protein F9K36_16525 [Burkholderiaceae bacterium]MBE7426684.1 hypothetical protein [Ideonella sp.]MCC7287205.1 hypothetical protein [Burkholderiaceae bacterium]